MLSYRMLLINQMYNGHMPFRDSIASTDEMQLSFRVVKALNDNQAIIGLIDVRRFDLTRRFRHLYVDGQYKIDER